ncbi:MAG: sigma-70 family RNA polymerase sigma factor [Planctomycetota bacterium]
MTDRDALSLYVEHRDPEAFAYLVRTYEGLVYSACRRRLEDPADIEDAVQTTFIKLAEKARTIRTSLASWLYRCALNAAADIGRGRSRRATHERGFAEAAATAESHHEFLELQRSIDEALLALGEGERELIVEHYFQRRTQAEMAEAAGVSRSMMSKRVQAAVSALRERLSVGAVAIPSTGLATCLAEQGASAAVPASLNASLIKLGVAGVGSGTGAGSGGASSLISLGGLVLAAVKAKPIAASLSGLVVLLGVIGAVVVANSGASGGPVAASDGDGPMRVGVILSRRAYDIDVEVHRAFAESRGREVENAEWSFAFQWHSRIADQVREFGTLPMEMVAVVDPGTADDPAILRRAEALGIDALIAGDDVEAMTGLDVILMSATGDLTDGTLDALLAAVKSGTGLLAIGWMPDHDDPRVLELLGTDKLGYVVRFGGQPAELVSEHPVFPEFMAGDEFVVNPNGVVVDPADVTPILQFSAAETARLEREQIQDYAFDDGVLFTPMFTVEVGQGRVLYIATAGQGAGGRLPISIVEGTGGEFVDDSLRWLAEGKAEAREGAPQRSPGP